MNGYLLIKNHATDELAIEVYTDRAEAIRAYNARELAKGSEEEVVLLFAESEGQLRTTHSRFFLSAREIAALPHPNRKARAAS
jgi:hypothetical protein